MTDQPMPSEDIIQEAIQLASQGNVDAQKMLAYMYGSTSDFEKSFYWFNKAVEQGDIQSMGGLAHLYRKGKGVPKDVEKALNLYKKAADKGDANAQYSLAVEYYNRYIESNVPEDFEKALEFFKKGVEQGYDQAQYSFAKLLDESNLDNNPETNVQAIMYYGLSAEQGNIDAQFRLGEMHLYGTPERGVKKSFKIAAQWMNLVRNNSGNSNLADSTRKEAEKLWNKYELWKYE